MHKVVPLFFIKVPPNAPYIVILAISPSAIAFLGDIALDV